MSFDKTIKLVSHEGTVFTVSTKLALLSQTIKDASEFLSASEDCIQLPIVDDNRMKDMIRYIEKLETFKQGIETNIRIFKDYDYETKKKIENIGSYLFSECDYLLWHLDYVDFHYHIIKNYVNKSKKSSLTFNDDVKPGGIKYYESLKKSIDTHLSHASSTDIKIIVRENLYQVNIFVVSNGILSYGNYKSDKLNIYKYLKNIKSIAVERKTMLIIDNNNLYYVKLNGDIHFDVNDYITLPKPVLTNGLNNVQEVLFSFYSLWNLIETIYILKDGYVYKLLDADYSSFPNELNNYTIQQNFKIITDADDKPIENVKTIKFFALGCVIITHDGNVYINSKLSEKLRTCQYYTPPTKFKQLKFPTKIIDVFCNINTIILIDKNYDVFILVSETSETFRYALVNKLKKIKTEQGFYFFKIMEFPNEFNVKGIKKAVCGVDGYPVFLTTDGRMIYFPNRYQCEITGKDIDDIIIVHNLVIAKIIKKN